MSLNALQVALQGLFQLTPIAIAVQGLIESLQQNLTVSRMGGGSPSKSRASGFKQNLAPVTDYLSVEEVQSQWELLELRLKNAKKTATAQTEQAPLAIEKIASTVKISKPRIPDAVDPVVNSRNEQDAMIVFLLASF